MRRLLSGSATLLLLLTACAIRVTPPVELEDPRTIFIADYGRHASLLLPRVNGRLVEFAYGEWEWFALGHDQWYRAGPALLWPTRGTLGKSEFRGPAELDALRAQLAVERVDELQVERTAASALLARLEAAFAEREGESVLNDALGMDFVPHVDGYCIFHQCNSVVAEWLRELGCRVAGCALRADFIVRKNP